MDECMKWEYVVVRQPDVLADTASTVYFIIIFDCEQFANISREIRIIMNMFFCDCHLFLSLLIVDLVSSPNTGTDRNNTDKIFFINIK